MGRDEVDQCESCLQEAYARERSRCEAEMQKLRRMVECLVRILVEFYGECPPDKHAGEECKQSAGCLSCWVFWAEQAVAEEFSPKG